MVKLVSPPEIPAYLCYNKSILHDILLISTGQISGHPAVFHKSGALIDRSNIQETIKAQIIGKADIPMISFDLDMTLLDHKTGEITPSALESINKLRKKHKIVLATGRDMDNYYSSIYRDIIRPDAIVHMNGTKITVGDTLIFEHHFNKVLLKELLDYCDREGYGIGMTLGDDDFYIHPEVIEASDIRAWGSCGRRFKDPWQMLDMNIRTLAFIGDESQVRRVEAEFPGLSMPLFAGRRGADVMERGISKADGLTRLALYFGENEDLSDTVAFGDSMNDLEVIIKAGTGVAMGNAVDELKEAADYVTSSIAEDGIYRACLHLGLLAD